MSTTEIVFLSAYTVLMALLSVIAFHRCALALSARFQRKRYLPSLERYPTVLVQVPLYNERYVAERVVDQVCRLEYPREKLSIQILDDSTDGTSQIVAEAVQRWAMTGIDITHVRRGHRTAYKAGALAHGLTLNFAELVAVFDADFLPHADMLLRLVAEFDDPQIGMVQARWAHLNRGDSWLTHAQAIMLDGHFANEHGGRAARGCFWNFNGTAGIWRRAAIDDAGGWSGETLTEDLELSYRAQLRGWKFLYREDVDVPGELPPDTRAFKAQQFRWAKGSIETALLLLPRIWRANVGVRRKLEATFHLGGNFAYPLVLVLTLAMPWAIQIRVGMNNLFTMILDATFLIGSTGSLVTFYMLAEQRVGSGWRALKHLPLVLALGIGMAVNNSKAVLEALMQKRTAFERTPKFGGKKNIEYRVKAEWAALFELGLGAYLLGAFMAAVEAQRWFALPFLALFCSGFLMLAFGSLWGASVSGPTAGEKALTATARASRI